MTIKEFYEWAVKNGVENYTIVCSYADSSGIYLGSRDAFEPATENIDRWNKEVEI